LTSDKINPTLCFEAEIGRVLKNVIMYAAMPRKSFYLLIQFPLLKKKVFCLRLAAIG